MKNSTISTWFFFLLFAGVSNVLFAQQSDYQIQQDFRQEYNQLISEIDAISTDTDLSDLSGRIDAFETQYSTHSGLINAAIFPDNYSSRVRELRTRFAYAEESVDRITELNDRIGTLTEEIDQFRNRLEGMNTEVEQLQEEILSSESNEQRLSGLITQYRENLQTRDRFVADFLESLLKKYETMDTSQSAELSEAAASLEESPLDLIRTILSEYIQYADQGTGLATQDYLRMKTQQIYFGEIWGDIGENISEVFASDAPVQARQEITDLLANWNSSINSKMWDSLTTSFNQAGYSLNEFTSSEEFYNAVLDYITVAASESREINTEEDFQKYKEFSGYWNNTVKSEWGEYLIGADILNTSQIADVDQELDGWSQASLPVSNLMLVLFLVSIVVIIGLVVLLVRKK